MKVATNKQKQALIGELYICYFKKMTSAKTWAKFHAKEHYCKTIVYIKNDKGIFVYCMK